MERLRRYDIYAPVAISDKEYSFSQAADMVLDSFNQFDGRMAEMAQRVFLQQHLDSEVRKRKARRRFLPDCSPILTPWVHVNYQGKASDVATMAHELGHAIHSMLASDHTLFTAHASLPLAETASTFGEMMLVDRLFKRKPTSRSAATFKFPPGGRCLCHHRTTGLFRTIREPGSRDGQSKCLG